MYNILTTKRVVQYHAVVAGRVPKTQGREGATLLHSTSEGLERSSKKEESTTLSLSLLSRGQWRQAASSALATEGKGFKPPSVAIFSIRRVKCVFFMCFFIC